MRKLFSLLALACPLLVLACEEQAQPEEAEIEPTADTTEVATETRTISLDDLAGTWNMRASPADADTVDVEYRLEADSAGLTLYYSDRDPVPAQIIEVAGDSIVTRAGPYESVLRPGVTVTVDGVWRLEGDRLRVNTVARYETTGPDSVVRRRAEGTRAP